MITPYTWKMIDTVLLVEQHGPLREDILSAMMAAGMSRALASSRLNRAQNKGLARCLNQIAARRDLLLIVPWAARLKLSKTGTPIDVTEDHAAARWALVGLLLRERIDAREFCSAWQVIRDATPAP